MKANLKLLIGIVIVSFFSSAFAREEVVLSLIINAEKKGDTIGLLEGKKIYLPVEDLVKMGIKRVEGSKTNIDGKEYIDLSSWKEIKFEFNEDRLELNLIVPPNLLPEKRISFYPTRRQDVIVPEQNSTFLNYSFDYSNIEGRKNLFVNHELGVRMDRFTFLTRGFYSSESNRYTRLTTGLYMDNRQSLNRLILGDFITPATPTTFGSNMVGISYFRNFKIDPYFIYRPTFDIKTLIPYRSDLEVYLDGVLIRKETVPPGQLNLEDIYYYGGRKDIRIVVRDPFGRVQEISYPLYFTDLMLKEGIREFNYSVGFLREGFTNSRYTHLGLFFLERYGFSNYLNFGGQVIAIPGKNFYNVSGEARVLLNRYGVLSLLGSNSYLRAQKGYALMSSYSYTKQSLGFRATGLYASENYNGSYYQTKALRGSFSMGASYFLPSLGSLSVDMVHNRFKDEEKNSLNLVYNKTFRGVLNFFLNFTKNFGKDNSYSFFVGVNLYPRMNFTASAMHQDILGSQSQVLQFSKIPPVGEGYGYRMSLERTSSSEAINPYIQYRSRYGVVEAEGYFRDSYERSRVTYSGAIAYVDGTIGITRPVSDSFGLFRVGDVRDVTVSLNGQPIGKTNRKGFIFLPELSSYYDNIIKINDKEIPLEYNIPKNEIAVSPWFKSGFCIDFSVERVYRYSGYFKVYYLDTGEKKPLEFYEFTIENLQELPESKKNCVVLYERRPEKEMKAQTGKAGEFYLEGLRPGTYKVRLDIDGKTVYTELKLKDKGELVNDLGIVLIPIER